MANPEFLLPDQDLKVREPIIERSFANTRLFLEEVSDTHIDLKTQTPPKHPSQTPDQWEKTWTIVGLYFGTDDKVLEEIGRDFHLTRERVRQIIKKGVETIHQNASPQLKERFPLQSLGFKKPLTLYS